jgi:hypothetical protein
MPHWIRATVLALAAAAPAVAGSQIVRSDPAPGTKPAAVDSSMPPAERARAAQADFERFRRSNLPPMRGGRPGTCQETVGRFCYWYDEKATMPAELAPVAERRKQLIALFDTLGHTVPDEPWIAGQRVRYLIEDGRPADAIAAARGCSTGTWWCDVLLGYASHAAGEYATADSVYAVAFTKMLPRDACAWNDISMLLDPDALQQYRRLNCGDPKRRAFEDRTWWFSRTLYLMHGNDSRTEYFARMTLAQLLKDAATPHQFGFDDDERELMLRFGPSIAWARGPAADPRDRFGFSIISHEPVPAYRYIPAGFVLNNPAISDSADWRLQLPPVIGRYAPPYAKVVRALEHQKAMFRRGDTALVVVSYDAKNAPEVRDERVEAAVTVSPGDVPKTYQARKSASAPNGILTVKAPWGPLIMSAEVAAPAKSAIARARYGISPPYAVGTRVSLSDLLFYRPYGEFPRDAEQAIPHALPTERVLPSEKLGVFWEAYNTDPNGEKMQISLRVEREVEDNPGFLRRRAQALGVAREITPVSVTVQDMSALGTRVSPRAIELDISTLPKGRYVVHLEISVAGQYVITTDHKIEIISP